MNTLNPVMRLLIETLDDDIKDAIGADPSDDDLFQAGVVQVIRDTKETRNNVECFSSFGIGTFEQNR